MLNACGESFHLALYVFVLRLREVTMLIADLCAMCKRMKWISVCVVSRGNRSMVVMHWLDLILRIKFCASVWVDL